MIRPSGLDFPQLGHFPPLSDWSRLRQPPLHFPRLGFRPTPFVQFRRLFALFLTAHRFFCLASFFPPTDPAIGQFVFPAHALRFLHFHWSICAYFSGWQKLLLAALPPVFSCAPAPLERYGHSCRFCPDSCFAFFLHDLSARLSALLKFWLNLVPRYLY
jgi:hypothetical protein